MMKHPIFVGGVGRSGTTLLTKVMSAHPDVLAIMESRFLIEETGITGFVKKEISEFAFRHSLKTIWREKIIRAIQALHNFKDLDSLASPQRIDGLWQAALDRGTSYDDVGRRFTDSLFSMIAAAYGRSIWLEKTPGNVEHFDRFAEYWPNAAFIHIIRDPVDVASSMMTQWWAPSSVAGAVDFYNRAMDAARDARAALAKRASKDAIPPSCLVLSLEDLTQNPKDAITWLGSSIGLDLPTNILGRMASIPSAQHANIGRGGREFTKAEINRIRKGTKKNYAHWLKLARS